MAKIIMIQGTSSGVGKSVLSTALCRIFTQDGYKTAPFKSQNMSSNSHTCEDGGKMARSQAIAAYACNCKPHTDMNPVLLVPAKGGGAQVVINGKLHGLMDCGEYAKFKPVAFEHALSALNRLAAAHDIVVIEGAGSPVELNLIENDIVNMGLATAVGAPVILVSDITRGGVFAALYGTVKLLDEKARKLVKALVVNKFRGDMALFEDGVAALARICEVPVAGVVPHTDIRLEDEDNLTDYGCSPKTKALLTDESGEQGGDSERYIRLLNEEFDRLAAHFRAHLDMDKIYAILRGER